jgi:tripartite-type tricarboxylate transporter receptor subunit TctC
VKRIPTILLVAAWFAAALTPAASRADEWPSRPVRIVNGFAPGGAADVLARLAADQLTTAFGQQFFVETRAGAGGVIAVQAVAHAEPDGYNFVITTLSLMALTPIINPKVGFDPLSDLTNIAYLAGSPVAFLVSAASPVKSLGDFVARGKTGGRPLTYSSSGVGSNGHLLAEYFRRKAGIPVEHVPARAPPRA